MFRKHTILLLLFFSIGCSVKKTESIKLTEGIWRAVITRLDGIEIPFNFTVNKGGKVFYVLNGSQKLELDSIRYKGDSIFLKMPFFNSDFSTRLKKDGSLTGIWTQHFPDTNHIFAFSAHPNLNYRILKNPKPPKFNISGQWLTNFTNEDQKVNTRAFGKFKQVGNQVTGTFLVDFDHDRYLQGVVNGDSLVLSTFDGSHLFLFKGLIKDSSHIVGGVFYKGLDGKELWTAEKTSTKDFYSATIRTFYKQNKEQLNFSFPDLNGDSISINDSQFKNKVVIVQILGSWCANCMEETKFLNQWYRKNQSRGVAIVGLCYERSAKFKEAVQGVLTFQNRFSVSYPLLLTGVPLKNQEMVQNTLSQLKGLINFPMLIFLNKKGNISIVIAGAPGPSNPGHFKAYKKEFNKTVDSLLKEG